MMLKWQQLVPIAMEHTYSCHWTEELKEECGPGRCSLTTRSNSQITVCVDVVAPGTHGDLWSKAAAPQSPAILWMPWVVSGPVFNLCRSLRAGVISSDELQVSSLTPSTPATFSVWLSFLFSTGSWLGLKMPSCWWTSLSETLAPLVTRKWKMVVKNENQCIAYLALRVKWGVYEVLSLVRGIY